MQINELSGKVMKLQYENRVLVSNVQRCDLAAHLGTRAGSPPREGDADSDAGRRESAEEEEEEAGRLMLLHPKREGPVGGESDSEDLFEKTTTTATTPTTTTSGFGSGAKPSELAGRRREERETLANVRREAERLGRTVDRLIADTDSLIYEGRLLVMTGGEGLEGGGGGYRGADATIATSEPKPDAQALDAVNARMKAFRAELHVFVEKVDRLGEGARERADDLSPMPNLTESSSFLSSMSRDSPSGTLGRDLVTDFQSGQRDELAWRLGQERPGEAASQGAAAQIWGAATGHSKYSRPPRGLRAELRDADPERRLRPPQDDREGFSTALAQEDERGRLEARRGAGGLELAGLQAYEALPWAQERGLLPWAQERSLLQQELRLFRHNTLIFYMKLRWILVHWRLGRGRGDPGDEAAHSEYEKLESLPELGVVMEQGEGEVEREDRSCPQPTLGDTADTGPPAHLPSPEHLLHQRQVGENRRVLQGVRALLEEFRAELREEGARRGQLQQSYANDKASWEVKWAEVKCHVAQLEEDRGQVRGEAQGGAGGGGGGDPDWAFQQEREEHRRLLADSHRASLDLGWRLQHGEKRWGRERGELLERFDRERLEWDGSMRDMHRKMERLQRELNARRGEGSPSDLKDGAGAHRGALFSPQDSPCTAPPPRSPRSPRSTCTFTSVPVSVPVPLPVPVSVPVRSRSDSEAGLEEGAVVRLKGPPEKLFLDALSLDPLGGLVGLGGLAGPLPSRLDGDKRFHCVNEALNEMADSEDPSAFQDDEEMGSGSLLRAKSVCSMSDFQRLMDSSPFLPDKSHRGDHGGDDATPPLSPDDLKYIEEFNSKGWDFPPGPPGPPLEPWNPPAASEPFQQPSWYLTTSATLTTNTLSSPEHCHKSPLRGNGAGVHVLHSPTRLGAAERPPAPPDMDLLYSKGTKGRGGELGAGAGAGVDEAFGGGRWHHKDLLEGGGLRPPVVAPPPVCPAVVGYAASLELQLSRNLSDDMKEVAFSAGRQAVRPPGPVRDTACQTNGFTTRGTQTTQTISVGLQTDALRTLTSSPHRCLTPKGGGSTPISSPSRSLRKVQYSPGVQSKFERPCCSPKYGSPKLQRKLSTASKADLAPASAGAAAPPRAPTPTTPQKGNSESAWARSTTTRDSPVHTTINDGLSSLFNIIDHTPVGPEPALKFAKSPSRSRPAEPGPPGGPGGPADAKSVHGAVQEFLRSVRGRSPSPVQVIVESQGEKTPEVLSVRQDLSAPPGYTLAENAARLLNKKMLEQGFREEKRLEQGFREEKRLGAGSQGRPAEGDRVQSASMEDLPRSPVAPPLESCFLRPARPANRRPPSRWAAHSPSSSPRWAPDHPADRRFTYPPTTATSTALLEQEEQPGQEKPPA